MLTHVLFEDNMCKHAACVYRTHKCKEVKILIAEEEGVCIWMCRKWRGRVSTTAVPSNMLNQAFLQRFLDCTFNSLDEQVALHCKVLGLSSPNRLFLTAAQALLTFIHYRS